MKKIAIFMILLSVSTIIMGIGYAAIDNVTLELSGNTSVKKIDNIRITKVEYKSDLLANKEESKINHFNKTTINSKISLGNDINSTISYEVTLRNDTDSTYKYVGAVNDNSKEFYDNDNIGYEVSGIDNNELLQPDTEKVVTLTFKYKSEPIDNQILNSYINIKFIKIYNIEYVNIDSNDLTEYLYDTNGSKYTRVEYLESNGLQYIDTNFKPNQDTKVEADFSFYKKQTEFYFGARENYELNTYSFLQDVYGLRSDYFNQVGNDISSEPARVKIIKDKNITTINDSIISTINYNKFVSDYNMYIFSINEKNISCNPSSIKLYSFKIYDNDSLVRDYIPVINLDKKPCLFDNIGKKCYYNQGDGDFKYLSEFIIHKDNNDKLFYEVDYLESTGTQYIDTLVNATSNITLDTSIYGEYSNVSWYGARDNNYIGIFNYNGRFDYVGIDTGYVNPTNNVWHTISHGKSLIIDEQLIKNYTDKIYETNYSIYLFTANNGGSVGVKSSIKMRKTTIKNGDTLIRVYIPVIDENNRPCFFDDIEKKCYYNQGTGDFLYG